jgi:hypothetical protein
VKVRELIALLEDMDADADVFLMEGEAWAFEVDIAGVCERRDFTECETDEDPQGAVPSGRARWEARETRLPANDVFLIEGEQTRYGNKAAWEAARR